MTADIEQRSAIAQSVLEQSKPAEPGDIAHKLMQDARARIIPPQTVRTHDALPYVVGGECFGAFPALVMALHDGRGQVVGLEAVYIAPDAGLIEPVQTMLIHESPGSHFRVDCPMGPSIGVALALDNAIAARHLLDLPVSLCAVTTASDLAAFDWPDIAQELAIFATDATATEAEHLADRARAAGLAAEVFYPPTPGASWHQEMLLSGAVPADDVAARKADEH